jgi:hypothetical protein
MILAKTGLLKTICDGKIPFTMSFLGLQLPGSWLPILGKYTRHWNALIQQNVEMAAIFLNFVPKMAKMRVSRPFLRVKCHLPCSFWDSSSQYYD